MNSKPQLSIARQPRPSLVPVPRLILISALALMMMYACGSGGGGDTTTGPDEDQDPITDTPPAPGFTGDPASGMASDPDVMARAFDPYNTATTRFDTEYFYVESEGIPEHQMMVGIIAWIAQVPVLHPYTGTTPGQSRAIRSTRTTT